jgi:hypothetical protein
MRSSSWTLAGLLLLSSEVALAQEPAPSTGPALQPSAAGAEVPAAPAAEPAVQVVPPPAAAVELPAIVEQQPPPAAAVGLACVPDCRSGFTCHAGQCVSLCNPPCSIGDLCTSQGECVARPPEPARSSDLPPADHGTHTHDGFFLRMTTGPGGGRVGLDIPDQPEQSYTGGGWSMSVDVGGAVTRDLAVFGRLRGAWMFSPALRIDGDKVADSDGRVVDQGLFGAGLNYYVMPLNLYFAGAIGFASVEAVRTRRGREDLHDSSRIGFGIDLDVGKEWWVSDNWGLGATLRLSLASVPASEDLPRHSIFGGAFLALLFSATYQ